MGCLASVLLLLLILGESFARILQIKGIQGNYSLVAITVDCRLCPTVVIKRMPVLVLWHIFMQNIIPWHRPWRNSFAGLIDIHSVELYLFFMRL